MKMSNADGALPKNQEANDWFFHLPAIGRENPTRKEILKPKRMHVSHYTLREPHTYSKSRKKGPNQ